LLLELLIVEISDEFETQSVNEVFELIVGEGVFIVNVHTLENLVELGFKKLANETFIFFIHL
jgi:hypothetical protein